MLDVEGPTPEPEKPGDAEAGHRLLEVEALEQVEDGEGEQEDDGELQRPQPSPEEVRRDDEERDGGGNRECVEHTQRVERLEDE